MMDISNLSDIISSLSDKDIENLKETAEQLFSGTDDKNSEPQSSQFSGIDPASLGKITKIMSLMNSSSSDPRCDLIKALKPLLQDDKRYKADQVLQIMKMFRILPILNEMK